MEIASMPLIPVGNYAMNLFEEDDDIKDDAIFHFVDIENISDDILVDYINRNGEVVSGDCFSRFIFVSHQQADVNRTRASLLRLPNASFVYGFSRDKNAADVSIITLIAMYITRFTLCERKLKKIVVFSNDKIFFNLPTLYHWVNFEIHNSVGKWIDSYTMITG